MKKILGVIDFLLVFFIILNFKSIYSQAYNKNFHINIIIIMLSIIEIFIYVLILKKGKNIQKRNIKKITYLLIYIFIFYIFNVVLKVNEYYIIFWINFGFIILILDILVKLKIEQNDIISLIKIFIIEMTILGIISVILYLCGSIFHIIKPTGKIEIIWGSIREVYGYFGLNFETQSINGIFRNSGIFVEGPIYASILTIALALNLFVLKNKYKLSTIIIIVTLFTTLTTTGIIYSTICIVTYFIFNKNKTDLWNNIKITIIPLILIIGISIISSTYLEKIDSNSAKIRKDDITSSIKTWSEAPIFGVGYLNLNAIRDNMANFRNTDYELGYSEGAMEILAECGLYMFSFYIISITYLIIFEIKRKEYSRCIMILLFTIIAFTTSSPYTAMMYLFGISGYNINKKEYKINE